jgi:hypothetical protein
MVDKGAVQQFFSEYLVFTIEIVIPALLYTH